MKLSCVCTKLIQVGTMEPGSNINSNNFPAINKNALRETNMYINNHNAFNFYEFSAVLVGLLFSK